ncbi:MAG: NifU family protein [Alphaproteobacteria bacterium]|nr:NifU family protein [Alphaproteobacteria bacterium]
MFIQTESTPNPETLKFMPGVEVMGDQGPVSISSEEEAKSRSPLAASLFEIGRVKSVFLGSDFVSVTKIQDADWSTLKVEILTTIMDHFLAGKPVLSHADASPARSTHHHHHGGGCCGGLADDGDEFEDTELTKQIKELLETRVRPAVAQDGGDITFKRFNEETGIVYLELHGACSGCPSSTATLKQGIENMLKYYVPEITAVEAVN